MVDLTCDRPHELVALDTHNGGEGRRAEHAAERSLEEWPEAGAGNSLSAGGLIEEKRIGDAPAGEGIDDKALLIRRDHLLRGGIEIEQPLVEIFDILHERNFEL